MGYPTKRVKCRRHNHLRTMEAALLLRGWVFEGQSLPMMGGSIHGAIVDDHYFKRGLWIALPPKDIAENEQVRPSRFPWFFSKTTAMRWAKKVTDAAHT